jgi:hypothetical protein
MGIAEAYIAFTSSRVTEASAYLPSALAFLAGNVLLLSPALVKSGLLILLIAILTVDGFGKVLWPGASRQIQVSREGSVLTFHLSRPVR